jgi:hypothetical protein
MRVAISTALLLTVGFLDAQVVREVRLLSEFQRMDPFGEILAVDRAVKPREILSPAVARNSFFSVQFAVTADHMATYFLAIQSYPEKVFKWRLYRQGYSKQGSAWVPDTLVEEQPPYFQTMPDPTVNIPGQRTQTYLLDVWVPPETPSSGARLEVLVKSDTWRIAPMEMRILPVTIPESVAVTSVVSPLPDPGLSADATAAKALATFLAGEPLGIPEVEPRTLRAIIYRNALQDLALSRTLEEEAAERCWDATTNRKDMGAEWYLRVRDCLYRTAWKK